MTYDLPKNIKLLIQRLNDDLHKISEKKCENKSFDEILKDLGYLKDELNILKIAFANCGSEKDFHNSLGNYLDENYKIKNSDNNGEINNDSSVILKKALLVIQFLTKTSYDKFNTNLSKAVELIARKRTKNMISSGQNMSCFELVPVLNRSDTFGSWIEDHLNNQLILWIKSESEKFPSQWKTDNQTQFEIVKEKIFEGNYSSVISQDQFQNIKNMSLLDFFQIRMKFSELEIDLLIREFESRLITSVDEIINLSDTAWITLNNLFPTKIDKIRAEISKQSSNSDDQIKREKLSQGEELAEWHKTMRFLFYEADMHEELSKISLLSSEALAIGIEEQKKSKSFNGGPMLKKIKQFFDEFTIKPNEFLSQSHGMLMYGPPGTGKTSLINVIIKKTGLKKIVEPFASTELNRGIVGETERVIRDVIRRGNAYPYLLCCCAIDEIDAVVPKRDNSSNNQKLEALTQFLTIIGGINDVKNVYVIGATNRFNKIDDAFLRRLGHKFYVGNLTSNERFDLIKSIQKLKHTFDRPINFDFIQANSTDIKVLTTNFTGAATNFLKSQLIQYFSLNNDKSCLDNDTLFEIIHQVATTYKVKFGGMTLADLMRTGSFSIYKQKWKEISEQIKFPTGRILIDLTPDVLSMQFEQADGTLYEIKLTELGKGIKFLSDLVPFLLYFCIHYDIDYVKFVDSDYIILQGAEEKSSTMNLLLDCFIDFDNYDKGLLLFDGDTIVGVDSSGTQEASLSEELGWSIVDREVWKNCILHIFKKLTDPYESLNKKSKSSETSRWCLFVTSSKFLVDSFKSSLKFPLSANENEDRQLDKDNKELERKCVNCNKWYFEKDNNLDSCSYHPDLLVNRNGDYDISKRLTVEELEELVLKEKNPEIFKNYVWFCCVREYSNENGCRKNKHTDKEKRQELKNFKSSKFFDNLEKKLCTIEYFERKNHYFLACDLDRIKFVKFKTTGDQLKSSNLFELKMSGNIKDIKYAVKCKFNEKYLCIDSHRNLNCSATLDESEKFQIYYNNDDQSFSIHNSKKEILIYKSSPTFEKFVSLDNRFKDVFFKIKPIDPFSQTNENHELNKLLSKSLYSIESILNKKKLHIQDDGYSPLFIKDSQINEDCLFRFEQINEKYFAIRSLLNNKYVTIDPDSNELKANETIGTSVFSQFEISQISLEPYLICLRSSFKKYVILDECLNQLVANSNDLITSAVFELTSYNNRLRPYLLNYKPGFYSIRVNGTKFSQVSFKQNTFFLTLTSKHELDLSHGIFKLADYGDDVFGIISKSNDLFLCMDSGTLFFDSYKSNYEEKYKFRMIDGKIQSVNSPKFFTAKNNLITIGETFEIFEFKKIESIQMDQNNDYANNLDKNYFSIDTYINDNCLVADEDYILRPSQVFSNNLFRFEKKGDSFKILLKNKIIYLKNGQLCMNMNELEKTDKYELFEIDFFTFDPTLISIKIQNKYVRFDLKDNNLIADTVHENIDETNMFRIKNQNIKIF